MSIIDKVGRLLVDEQTTMREIRRDLHMHPEISFHEFATAKKISEFQHGLGLDVRTNVGGMGVVATLKGRLPGPTVALRADFDALPIQEENDVPYRSRNDGVMHACGHDAHTAIVLGISTVLSRIRDDLTGNIVFIHQHAEEEDPGGAKSMIEDGALDGVDAIFATHMENYIPVGKIWHSNSYVMASSDDFIIDVHGIGGHAAMPHDSVDPITIGAQIVISLQQVISRKLDPLKSSVVSIGSINSGEAPNVIPGSLRLTGTVRTFDANVRKTILEWLDRIVRGTCNGFGASCDISILPGAPAILNDPYINSFVISSAEQVLGEDGVIQMEPNLGAEDFSFFLDHVPGAYFFTGSANPSRGLDFPYHSPRFDIDEESLLIGAQIMAGAALRFLERGTS